jgi:hypothetical protein
MLSARHDRCARHVGCDDPEQLVQRERTELSRCGVCVNPPPGVTANMRAWAPAISRFD